MIDLESVINFALSLEGAKHEFKSDWNADLIRIYDKIFVLMHSDPNGDIIISLKCDPDWAIELRDMNEHIIPGFHLNKKHWNSIEISKIDIDLNLIKQMVKHSYDMVIANIPQSKRKY